MTSRWNPLMFPLTWRPTVLTVGPSGGKLIDLFLATTDGLRDVEKRFDKHVTLDRKHLASVSNWLSLSYVDAQMAGQQTYKTNDHHYWAATVIWPKITDAFRIAMNTWNRMQYFLSSPSFDMTILKGRKRPWRVLTCYLPTYEQGMWWFEIINGCSKQIGSGD